MTELLGAVETAIRTDFALLYANQKGAGGGTRTMTYAATSPGEVALVAGTKYANLAVRLERWDEQPPPAEPEWEDEDELPWEEVPGAGLLVVAGFDEPAVEGLDVQGIGRARVQVLAVGRHRYGYSSYDDEPPAPERWLLRVWPDPQARDALWGRPRRIAGPLPFAVLPREGWYAALRAWGANGWDTALLPVRAFGLLKEGFLIDPVPRSLDDLAERFGPSGHTHGPAPDGWNTPILGAPVIHETDVVRPHREDQQRLVERLADVCGMTTVETYRDALTCLQRLDLVLTTSDGRMVPNCAPAPAWHVLAPDAAVARSWRTQALRAEVGHLLDDLEHLLRWAPDGRLHATPQQIAVRLSLAEEDVLTLLRLAALSGMRVSPERPAPSQRVTITDDRVARRPGPGGG